tara:strand:- start:31645 stop:32169 length:525 start_codon:yes stop_codon:yes gene_type:complete
VKKKTEKNEPIQRNSKEPRAIDVDQIDLVKMKEKTVDLPGLLEYAHSVGGFSVVPTEQGVIKGKAMQAMSEQTQMHLDQIFEQMQLLAKQAKELKDRAQISTLIYEADINFQPVIGHTYYVYEKKDGRTLLSMVSPEEWGDPSPFKSFINEVRLLADHTWKIVKRDDDEDITSA